MPFPPISPIAFELGPLVVRWYALGFTTDITTGSEEAYHRGAFGVNLIHRIRTSLVGLRADR